MKQILCLSDMTAFSIVWLDKELYKNKKVFPVSNINPTVD